MFVALSQLGDRLYEKVSLFVALAPTALMSHASDGMLGIISKHGQNLRDILNHIQVYELFNHANWKSKGQNVCAVLPLFCHGASHAYVASQSSFNDV